MSDFNVGDVLASKYEIKAVLGAGGMGTVYRARQIDLGRDVAIKIPRPEGLEIPGFLARFTREARTVARLMHDNIVQVYEYSESDDLVYISMEFVEGHDLKALVGKPPDNLKVKDLATILRDACEGLSHAHEHGIVHRDIKPHNIMVQPGSRGKWRVKIMDFGIAHLEASANFTLQQEQLTMTGQAIGTPSYMSPEQIRGSGVSGKSDIYSMGCVIYYCFARTTPFQGSGFTVAAAHLSEPAPSIRARLPQLPDAVDQILHRCLAKEPGDRHGEASDLGQELFEALRPLFETPMAELWNIQADGIADTDLIPSAGEGGAATRTQGEATVTEPDGGATIPDGGPTAVDKEPASRPDAPPAPTQAATGSTRPYEGAPAAEPAAGGRSNSPRIALLLAAVIVPILVVGTVIGLVMASSGEEEPAAASTAIAAGPGNGMVEEPPAGGEPETILPAEPADEPVPEPEATPVAGSEAEPEPEPLPATPALPTPTVAPPDPTAIPTPTRDPFEAQSELARRRFERTSSFADRIAMWAEHAANDDPRWGEVTEEWALEIVRNPDMVTIGGSTHTMGTDAGESAEGPAHNVILSSYQIGRYEVSALELSVYLNDLSVAEARRLFPGQDGTNVVFDEEAGRFLPREGHALHPANGVSWTLASAYAEWLSLETGDLYRLPTEAEWEVAARSGSTQTYPWGNTPPAGRQANFAGSGTVAINGMGAGTSRDGIHHMAGNVAEWCLDYYDAEAYSRSDRRNPRVIQPPAETRPRRVLRGGSFLSRSAAQITSTRRDRQEADRAEVDFGFRLLREIN